MILQQSESERSRSRSRDKRKRQKRLEDREQEFQSNQEIIRSMLRIEQNRQQPIDKFVQIFLIYKKKYHLDSKIEEIMSKPKTHLDQFSIEQLEQIIVAANNFYKTEIKSDSPTTFANYWHALSAFISTIIIDKKSDQNISEEFKQQIEQTLKQPLSELLKLDTVIDATLKNPSFGMDLTFWENIKIKIQQRKVEEELATYYREFKKNHEEDKQIQKLDSEDEDEEPISPLLGPISIINPKLLTTEQEQKRQRLAIGEKIFKEQFQKCKERLEDNLSLGKNHNLLSTDIIAESTTTYDFITKEIMQFEKYKRMEEDEEEFDEWVPIETEGRYRDRKPQYINRARSSYQWNKYNQTHYNDQNPPPKVIQGYKFNIFYPDLYDKQKTPQYYLETTENPNYCLIKFKAGPPYKDIAFKILRKQWDFSEKSGFQSIFAKGILHLYFNFKKPRFRI